MYKRKDAFYRRAKEEGYRSRAAYKLLELWRAEKVGGPGQCIVDAGAAPGGWSQVLLGLVGKRGKVAAVDILPMDPLPGEGFRFFQDDLSLPSLPGRILDFFGRPADAVVSDAAPGTTGISFADQARSADLVRAVLALARKILRPGGTFLAKIFEGAEVEPVVAELRASFEQVKRVRPAATRKESFELYLLAKGFRGDPAGGRRATGGARTERAGSQPSWGSRGETPLRGVAPHVPPRSGPVTSPRPGRGLP